MTNQDPYRPHYHFTPPEGWMNDPNGFVHFEGEYHLFYQHLTPRHWGHAVSTDLVHWTHLPIALEPDELGEIWSGSAVVDWHNTTGFFHERPSLVAIFTHWLNGQQQQSLAYSTDRGRTWTRYSANPVIPNTDLPDFRDPKVFWHPPTNRWVMVVAAGPSVRFYTSPNLIEWHHASTLQDSNPANIWECPDLFELPVEGSPNESRWVLIASIVNPDAWYMHYLVGHFDGTTFTSDTALPQIMEYGSDFYAATSCSDIPPNDGRRILIAWMSSWVYAMQTPTGAWQSAMSIPRHLVLKQRATGITLVEHPIVELETLRGQPQHWENQTIAPGNNLLAQVRKTQLEILAIIEPTTATEFGVRVRVGDTHHTTIGYNTATTELFIDRHHSGNTTFHPAFATIHAAPVPLDAGQLRLRIFVDQSSVELFANDGEAALTTLIFPNPEDDGLELYTIGGEVLVHRLDLFPLKPVREQ